MTQEPKRPALTAPVRPGRRRRQSIAAAALGSVGLHAAVLGLAILWARYLVPVPLVPADIPATVQLVMSPPGGEKSATAVPQSQAEPAPQAPPQEQASPESPSAEAQTAETAPAPASAPPPPAPPAPTPSDNKLTLDFAQIQSDTNALVTGDLVVPASPDIKYHNRKPSYPRTAAWRGEQGAVEVLVHVAEDGLVSGADITRSSGYPALDQAALDAVRTWHFLPSVKNGQPMPTAIPMRFVFAID